MFFMAPTSMWSWTTTAAVAATETGGLLRLGVSSVFVFTSLGPWIMRLLKGDG